MKKTTVVFFLIIISMLETPIPLPWAQPATRFAVIGDYGSDNGNELAVSSLVKSWDPAFVITLGDNNHYSSHSPSGWQESVGDYYGEFIPSRMYPSPGNHDDDSDGSFDSYVDYFDVPRYYSFVKGPIKFYSVNSVATEPDGARKGSKQATWLQSELESSDYEWNLVYFHYPPYTSSSKHGPAYRMRWDFSGWGADAVFSGHNHQYERVQRNGIVYFVNGAGGAKLYDFGSRTSGSRIRLKVFGAQLVTVTDSSLNFKFIDVNGRVRDEYVLTKSDDPASEPAPSPSPNPTSPPPPSDSYSLMLEESPHGYCNIPPGVYSHPAGSVVEVRVIKARRYHPFTRTWLLDGVRTPSTNGRRVLLVTMDRDHVLEPVFR